MYRIVEGNSRGLADTEKFIDLINDPPGALRNHFDQISDIFVTRAPGRLDVMGGIADYSGSLVLEMPLAEATLAAIQKNNSNTIDIMSLSPDSDRQRRFEIDLSDITAGDYRVARKWFSRKDHWASYIAGIFFVLKRELGIDFKTGARILISSDIPIGKGVSSSAALEVSAMAAICMAYNIKIEPRELALLCQKVENEIVGAACGVMDQVTAHCGVENSLLSLICQPAEIGEPLHIPKEIEFWGIDSGIRHAVAGSDYTSVRIGAFIGYRIIAELAGFDAAEIKKGLVEINEPPWNGYLANVSPAEYEREFASKIPESIDGSEFLTRFVGTTDAVTTIDPAKRYSIKAPTEHAIYENFRVRAFAELLKGPIDDSTLGAAGELMFRSHLSYSACGLTEAGTDRIVEMVKENKGKDFFGARITGGGSGGTVAILARQDCGSAIAAIASRYKRETGRKPYIFHGSSPGCSSFGYLRLSPIVG